MNKKNKKLQLNKKVIANLDDPTMHIINGGASATIGMECPATISLCNVTNGKICRTTKGEDCDLWSIGHDDGSICLSRHANWCHGVA